MKKLLFTLLAGLLTGTLTAQTSGLGIGPDGIRLEVNRIPVAGDTASVVYGDILTYSVQIINNGNTALTDEFGIGIGQGDSFLIGVTILFPPQGGLDTLDILDTLRVRVEDTVLLSSALYSGGGGVVTITIWPAARVSNPGAPATDSAKVSLVIATTALDPSWKNRGLAVIAYPNPTHEQLFLLYGELKEEVECVIMTDSQGRSLQHFPSPPESIDLEKLPSGVYYLRLEGKNGQGASIKVVKR